MITFALVACLVISAYAEEDFNPCEGYKKKKNCNEQDECRWDVVEKECIVPATKCDGRGENKCDSIDICMWDGEKCRLGPVTTSVIDDARASCKAMFDKKGPDFVPPVVRLAFHDCVGGCDGCVDLDEPDNNGLEIAIDGLAKGAKKFNKMGLSRADYWMICAMVGNEIAQDPRLEEDHVDFPVTKTGRATCSSNNPKKGPHRVLPGPNGNTDFVLETFCKGDFDMTPRECVAIMGAHNLGQTLFANSGHDGPWTRQPNCLSNSYYMGLVNRVTWFQRALPGSGAVQWMLFDAVFGPAIAALNSRKMSRRLLNVVPAAPEPFSVVMMLNTDIALVKEWGLDEYDTSFGGSAPFYTGWLKSNFTSLENAKTFDIMAEFAEGNAIGTPPTGKVFFPEYEAAFIKMIGTLVEGGDELLDVIDS